MKITYAQESDHFFWKSLDPHLNNQAFLNMISDQRGYVLSEKGQAIGLLRYGMFWDEIPFCHLLMIKAEKRGSGYGTQLLQHWEHDMREKTYDMVLTSTRVDETAQHFYRNQGYHDCGCLLLDIKGHEQPMELFLAKSL